ncbi:MAG: DnaA regulatory inactivator Hda [Burkholderiales bacterium]|nr:DnaA regulatory inactivator Hda [Burkholderiales bacterium]MDQ3195538.1 DnaA regulatory inactivator Hda [Pseudomonadota bacterium]
MKQLALDIAPPAPPDFDNFIIGRNGESLQTLRDFVAGKSPERLVYLWGKPGSGRTHLLRAAVAARRGARYLHCADQPGLIAKDASPLALDDVERLGEASQIELFNLYNAKPQTLLLVAGSIPPAQLALREDVKTRLCAGLTYQVHALSDAEKIAALARCAEARGLKLSRDVGDYLLRHTQRDMRSLLALFHAADIMALAEKRDITVPLIKAVLHSALPLETRD